MTGVNMFDPVLLNTFVEVARARHFTEAGRRLGLRQSTVSQAKRQREETAARRPFVRDTHHVMPPARREAMLGFAQIILAASERARRYFAGSEARGPVRFGPSEDFVLIRLPGVLREFTRIHPAV